MGGFGSHFQDSQAAVWIQDCPNVFKTSKDVNMIPNGRARNHNFSVKLPWKSDLGETGLLGGIIEVGFTLMLLLSLSRTTLGQI